MMVTGVYHPETTGASLQCRQLVQRLRDRVDFVVLTTTFDRDLPASDEVDGVEVWRVPVHPDGLGSNLGAAVSMTRAFFRLRHRFDILHLHGFSQKSILLAALARASGKRVVIKLTSVGHDDPMSMRQRGGAAFWFYRRADCLVGVSPRFERTYRDAGMPPARYRFIPNAVDANRFRPAAAGEVTALRRHLGLPPDDPVILFVGFFSHEKRPDLLYEAWSALADEGLRSTLVLVGATRSPYYEIDGSMADAMRADAERRGLGRQVTFVERTAEIEKYYRAADIFVLPTLREGLPNVLLEAMGSGVPPLITRLEGITDWVVEHGRNGLLVPANDGPALTRELRALLQDRGWREALGRAARASVEQRFAPDVVAEQMFELYTTGYFGS